MKFSLGWAAGMLGAMTLQRFPGWQGPVNRNAGKWEAGIAAGEKRANGKRKRVYLGLFDDPKEAALAYDAAAREHFKDFASLNFPGAVASALLPLARSR